LLEFLQSGLLVEFALKIELALGFPTGDGEFFVPKRDTRHAARPDVDARPEVDAEQFPGIEAFALLRG
jgi:hypothetical protein